MAPTIGRIVHYVLTDADAAEIERRRCDLKAQAEWGPGNGAWPEGAQAHVGNPVCGGQIVAMVVTAVWPNEYGENVPGVNGQCLLDGNDSLWICSARESGSEPGTWHWPPQVA